MMPGISRRSPPCPGIAIPIGIARSWHFLNVYGFIITGLIFVSLLFSTTQWQRLVPTSETVFVQAWSTFVHYANFHFPPEPNGYYGYNALQQLTYFGMVFVMGPLSIATGLAMSPALVNHFSRFGGRQTARSIHFVAMLGYVAFIIAHVTLVALTGFMRNMNHIVVGTDDRGPLGMILGFVGIGVVLLCWVVAHYVSWKRPRSLQHLQRAHFVAAAARDVQSGRARATLSDRRSVAALLAERQDARARRLETIGRRSFPRLSAAGGWSGRAPRDIVALGVAEHWAWKSSSPCTTAFRAGPASRNGRACR